MSPLRIAVAIGQLIPGEGGAELQALRLAAALQRRGHQVEILTSRPAGRPAVEYLQGVPVRRLFAFGNARGLWRLGIYSFMGLVGETLVRERHRFDLVHVHQLLHTACAVMATRPLHRLPVLIKLATAGRYGDLHQMRTGQTAFVLSRQLLPLALGADRLVAISDEIARELQEAGVAPERIVRIPNGVVLPAQTTTPAARAAARTALGLTDEDEVVVYVGRCEPQKGPDLLLAAWGELRRRPRCHLFALGKGFPTDARFQRAALVSSRLRLPGRVADVTRYLAAADVLIHPSRGEGLSNALLEAMAHGLACVASGIQANVELLAGAGLLAPPEDGAALGRLAAELLDDPVRRQQIGLAGRRRAEGFSLEAVAERYERLYKELLGEPGPHRSAAVSTVQGR
ncbi:MAG: glycosyltransferase family 4 protein [Myxococcales bacterium]|nr:glycosyltransferase family 4 protein [Myxococcales bacterium]